MGLVNERGRFSTPHSSETPDRFSCRLLPGHDPACKIAGAYVDMGGLGK